MQIAFARQNDGKKSSKSSNIYIVAEDRPTSHPLPRNNGNLKRRHGLLRTKGESGIGLPEGLLHRIVRVVRLAPLMVISRATGVSVLNEPSFVWIVGQALFGGL